MRFHGQHACEPVLGFWRGFPRLPFPAGTLKATGRRKFRLLYRPPLLGVFLTVAVILVLSGIAVLHAVFHAVYTRRIRRFEADVADMERRIVYPDGQTDMAALENDVVGRISMLARINVHRTINGHAIIINGIFICGLAGLLAFAGGGGWMSALLLLVPAVLLFQHVGNLRGRSIVKAQ